MEVLGLTMHREVNVPPPNIDQVVSKEIRQVGDGMESLKTNLNQDAPLLSQRKISSSQSSSIDTVSNINQSNQKIVDDLKNKFSKVEEYLSEEKTALKNHLEVQVQVNQEIKRLLVASLGNDLAYHYERLATEKAQLAMEAQEMKEVISLRNEEIEKLNISCDIWRSKFLASRVQCDELLLSSAHQQKHMQNITEAAEKVLHEHNAFKKNVSVVAENLTLLNQKLRGNGQEPSTHQQPKEEDEAANCLSLSNELVSHLLGKEALSNKSGKNQNKYKTFLKSWGRITGRTKTAGETLNSSTENHLMNLLKQKDKKQINQSVATKIDNRKNRNQDRFHLQVNYENLTLNCCKHCKGEIRIV